MSVALQGGNLRPGTVLVQRCSRRGFLLCGIGIGIRFRITSWSPGRGEIAEFACRPAGGCRGRRCLGPAPGY